MNASPIVTPVRSRAASSVSASAVFDADRLFAQHVLAGLGRLDRQRHVQVVRQRIVDRVDLRVGEHLLVRAVGLRNPELARGLFGTRTVARRDRDDLGEFALLHGGNHRFTAMRATPSTPHRTLAIERIVPINGAAPDHFKLTLCTRQLVISPTYSSLGLRQSIWFTVPNSLGVCRRGRICRAPCRPAPSCRSRRCPGVSVSLELELYRY